MRLIQIMAVSMMLGLAIAIMQACDPQFGLKKFIPLYRENNVDAIEIISNVNANQNTATLVDIVFIYDTALLTELGKLTERDWFERREEIHLNNHKSLDILSWEMVPASRITNNNLPGRHKLAKGVLLFAYFINAKTVHRADISLIKHVTITLSENGFRLDQVTAAAEPAKPEKGE